MTQVPEKLVQRLKSCTNFPTPPAVAMQIIALAQDPEIDLGRVADMVNGEPAMAARIMRVANSGLYARRRQSTNLRQALIILGLNATLTLALSVTVVGMLRRDRPTSLDFNAYWRRAILAATWGKLLAGEFGRRDAEEVFLAALLQDIGMLALDKIAPDAYQGISPFQLEHGRVTQHEQTCVGTDHRSIGAWLLKGWKFPAQLIRAVQHSHDVTASGVDQEFREFVRCVAMSGELADVWLADRNEVSVRRAGALAHKHLGILPNRLGDMFSVIQEQLPVAESLFDMEIFPRDQIQDIVASGREILMIRNLRTLSDVQDLRSKASKPREANSALQRRSGRDALTGVFDRQSFEESVEREFVAAGKHKWPLSVVFVDLDHFKHVNETHGQQGGDVMLKEVANLLQASLRDTDIVARYGGDEFVLLLPGVNAALADGVAQRILHSSRTQSVDAGAGKSFSITLSLGVATYDSASRFQTPQDLLAGADAALYYSKKTGRDRYTCYDQIRAA